MLSEWLDIPGYVFYQVSLKSGCIRLKSGLENELREIETKRYKDLDFFLVERGFDKSILYEWISIPYIEKLIIDEFKKNNKRSNFKLIAVFDKEDNILVELCKGVSYAATEFGVHGTTITKYCNKESEHPKYIFRFLN